MIKKLFSVYSSNLVLGIFGIVSVPVLLNHIGVTGYGYYSIYLTLFSYFTLFELGIIKHFTKLIAQKNTEINEVVSCFYFFTSAVIFAFIPITIVAVHQLFDVIWSYAILIGIIVSLEYIIYLPTKIYASYAAANKNFEKLSLFNFISGFIRYTFILLGSILVQNIFIILLLLTIRRIFDLRLCRKIIQEKVRIFDISSINKTNLYKVFDLYKASIFLSGTQALQINLNGMVALFVSKLFGVEGLGYFRSVFDILSKIWFFSNGLGLVVFPYFSGNAVGVQQYRKYIFVSWIFYTVIFLFILFLFPMLNLLFLNSTIHNIEERYLFLFILIAVLFVAQSNLSFEFLQAKGKYKYLMLVTFITNMVFVIVTFLIYKQIPFTFSVIISWMISLGIQTICFEWKSFQHRSYILLVLLMMSIWVCIGMLSM